MFKPLNDYVLLEPVKEKEKKSAIILPDSADREKPERAKVIAMGPGKLQDGKRVSPDVKKGDIVVFKKYSFHEIKIADKEYLIGSADGIYGIE